MGSTDLNVNGTHERRLYYKDSAHSPMYNPKGFSLDFKVKENTHRKNLLIICLFRSLCESEKKRLEHEEDRLLSTMLFNLVAFMVMMQINKNEIKKKVKILNGIMFAFSKFERTSHSKSEEVHASLMIWTYIVDFSLKGFIADLHGGSSGNN